MRDRLTGVILCVVLVAAIVSPRAAALGIALIFVGLALAALLFVRAGRLRADASWWHDPALFCLLAFALWGLVSTFWSLSPRDSLLKPAFLALVVFTLPFGAFVWRGLDKKPRQFLGEGAIIAIGLGYAFMAIELFTDQSVTRAVMTMIPALYLGHVEQTSIVGGVTTQMAKHFTVVDGVVTHLEITNINRRAALLVCLMWPGIFLILQETNTIRRLFCALAVGIGLIAILVLSAHQSSQAAIIGSLVVFAVAKWRVRAARFFITGVWIFAVVFVVPVMMLVSKPEIYCSKNLFHSAEHRVVIWGTMARHVLERPVVGVGADATPEATKAYEAKASDTEAVCENGRAGSPFHKYARHAHNVYLQVWFELGLVGVILFLVAGLAVLGRIGRMPLTQQPYALALFSTVTVLMAFSYSLWQMWFLSSMGLGALLLMIAFADTFFDRQDDASG